MNVCFKHIIALVLVGVMSVSIAKGQEPPRDSRREAFSLHSKSTNDKYMVRVWLPEGYRASADSYPLLLMLDGEYAFNSALDVSDYLQRDGVVRPFIVVGLSYDVGFGRPLAAKRSRDFAPPTKDGVIQKVATAYYSFIKEELFVELKARYRIRSNDVALWSYSLSGAFATWLNYFDRQLFRNYIIASPNLEYGILDKLLAGEIFSSDEPIEKKVIMSMDPSEGSNPEKYFKPDKPEVIDPLQKLIAEFKGYDFRIHVTQGESHATSWFVSLPKSLRFIFGREEKKKG